jgi:uncharacterized membrane protein YciS (DUF1049 family)
MKLLINKKYSILSNILKYSFVFVFVLAMPLVTKATGGNIPCGQSGGVPCSTTVTGINFKIKNPINVDTIPQFIESLLNIVLTIGIPIVALAIIYCGFLFVKARGNSEEIKKAKGALMYTIVGAFLLLGAWVLATAIGATVKDIISTT